MPQNITREENTHKPCSSIAVKPIFWTCLSSLKISWKFAFEIQLTETRLTQRKKWWWPEVASYEEHSWVSTKVLSKKLILFSMYHKKTTWSGAYSFILDGFKWVCPLLCSWPQRLFSGTKSNYFKGYTKEASLAMYYWATDFKPDLTHGSIIKSEALVAVYLHYSNDVAFWISKKTEILCGPQL